MILVGLIALLLLVIAAVIAITQAQRRIAIQYAKRVVGRKQLTGQTQYLPLKVNYSGVMPIIFATAILQLPTMVLGRSAFPNAAKGGVALRQDRGSAESLVLRHLGPDDLLLQLLLGGDDVPAE